MQTIVERCRNLSPSPRTDRFRLISLGEIVKNFRPHLLMHLGFFEATPGPIATIGEREIDEKFRGLLQTGVGLSLAAASFFDMPVTGKKLEVMFERLKSNISGDEFSTHLDALNEIVEFEIESKLMLYVEIDKAKYYESWRDGWESVLDAYGSSAHDIEEAGKCIALNRYTAAVFHLMRLVELGLRSLAASLNDERLDPSRNPSWDSILKKCDEELAKPLHERTAEWKVDEPFFSGAAARLHAVKDAWRNPTMHIEMVYTEEMALDIWNHVQSFMRHLSTKLQEA